MTAFAAAMDALFADVNMAADAVYVPAATGLPVAIRVVRTAPDRVTDFAGNRLWSDSVQVSVRVSDVAAPMQGDRITLGGETRVVQGTPERDTQRLVWRLDTVPLP